MGDLVSIEIMTVKVIFAADQIGKHPAYSTTVLLKFPIYPQHPWVGDVYSGIQTVKLSTDGDWEFEFESEEHYNWFLLQQ